MERKIEVAPTLTPPSPWSPSSNLVPPLRANMANYWTDEQQREAVARVIELVLQHGYSVDAAVRLTVREKGVPAKKVRRWAAEQGRAIEDLRTPEDIRSLVESQVLADLHRRSLESSEAAMAAATFRSLAITLATAGDAQNARLAASAYEIFLKSALALAGDSVAGSAKEVPLQKRTREEMLAEAKKLRDELSERRRVKEAGK